MQKRTRILPGPERVVYDGTRSRTNPSLETLPRTCALLTNFISAESTNDYMSKHGFRMMECRDGLSWDVESAAFPKSPEVIRGGSFCRVNVAFNNYFLRTGHLTSDDIEKKFRTEVPRQDNTSFEGGYVVAGVRPYRVSPNNFVTFKKYSDNPTVVATDSFVTSAPFYSPCHVEYGGNEAISHLIVGRKLWLATTNAKAGNWMVLNLKTAENFLDFIEHHGYGFRDILYWLQKPGDAIVQPSLCAHAVLTFPDSDRNWAVLATQELKDLTDVGRPRRVLQRFGHGVSKGDYQVLIDKTVAAVKRSTWDVVTTEDFTGEVAFHIFAFVKNGYDLSTLCHVNANRERDLRRMCKTRRMILRCMGSTAIISNGIVEFEHSYCLPSHP